MKTINIFLLTIVLFFVSNTMQAQTQIIDVCGNDSIKLRVSNYQYGTIEWETSYDNITWEKIQGAQDTVYKFLPTKTKYYRAVVKFAECQPEYSEISFVQMPPVADAGADRVVPDNSVEMMANEIQGASGTWSIINGTGGSFTNANSPYAEFNGTDSTYTLVWSLTNVCGTSTDTINVKFVDNIYINAIAVVDSTDNIISDSTQMANGLYIIDFSDPAPTISNYTILLGLINDGFIRKVNSFTVQSDTFFLYTSQGNLEQITQYGSYDLAQVFSIDTILNDSKASNKKRLDHCPTRAELLNDPKYKTGNYYYIVENKPMYLRKGVTLSKTKDINSENALIDLDFNSTIFNQGGASLVLNGNYSFTPNLVAELDYSGLHLNTAKIGMLNGVISRNYQLNLDVSSSVNILDQEFTLLSLHKDIIFVVGGVPIWVRAQFNIDGQVSVDASASMNISHEYTKTSTYNAIIKYENNSWNYIYNKTSQVQNNNSFSVQGDLTQTFDIGPNISFKIYNVLGPYVDARLTEELNLCTYNANWKANMNLGGQISVGAKAEVLSFTLFDVAKTWSQSFYNLQFPYNLEMISGNNQTYNLGDQLNNKIKIRVLSNKGFPIPGAIVHFSPQNGGTVTNNTVISDGNGYAEITWTPNGSNQSKLEAYILDCDGNNLNNSPVIFNAYETSSSSSCSQSSLYVSIDEVGNDIKPIAHMGTSPYTYSTDGINFNGTVPQITPLAGQTYYFYVKDDNNCIASSSYSTPNTSCANSNLTVVTTVVGNDIYANAQNGNTPYLYSLDNATSGFNSYSTFFNVSAGYHTIYVKDNNNCTNSKTVYIHNNSTANIVTDIDGNIYQTIQIGSQVWMAENLKVTHYPNGDPIPLVTDGTAWGNLADNNTYDAMCYYNNNANGEADTYGALYTYAAAIGDNWARDLVENQGVCPDGWHLPTDAEWTTLTDYLGGTSVAGGKMKETGTTHWSSPNTADNSSGFSALPGGYRFYDGSFYSVGDYGNWWSATGYNSGSAYARSLSYGSANVDRFDSYKSNGGSVRCVRDY